jgi:ribosomal protein S18 acetylase RimI-like enzyme
MNLIYRKGNLNVIKKFKQLAIGSWSQFQNDLNEENWDNLFVTLSNENTYLDLINNSDSIVCETEKSEIIGMAFLGSSGNPTDIYDTKGSYIRFLTVDPNFGGKGIGRKLTEKCIDIAINNKEQFIALHTSIIMEKARHIYESLGFKILGELEPRLGKNIGYTF